MSLSDGGFLTITGLINDAQTFNFEATIKATSLNGLLFLNSNSGHFFGNLNLHSISVAFIHFLLPTAIYLSNGYFNYLTSIGTASCLVQTLQPIAINTWHVLQVDRANNEVTLTVDENIAAVRLCLSLTTLPNPALISYIGGLPETVVLPRGISILRGFLLLPFLVFILWLLTSFQVLKGACKACICRALLYRGL
jgi:hypothetical protein